MSSVTLPDLYIHLASAPATYVTATVDGETEKPSVAGRVGRYAGGRFRAITRPGTLQTFNLQLNLLPRATVDQLRTWAGTLLMFRDTRGRVWWGIYLEPAVTEIAGVLDDVADVVLDVTAVTYSAAV